MNKQFATDISHKAKDHGKSITILRNTQMKQRISVNKPIQAIAHKMKIQHTSKMGQSLRQKISSVISTKVTCNGGKSEITNQRY